MANTRPESHDFTHTVVTRFFRRQINEFFSSNQGVSYQLDSEDLKFDDKPSNLASQFRPHNIFTNFFHEKKEKRHVLVEFCTCSSVNFSECKLLLRRLVCVQNTQNNIVIRSVFKIMPLFHLKKKRSGI